MERAPREADNPALERAVSRARMVDAPLEVVMALEPSTVGPTERHAAFVLGGLAELDAALGKRGIRLNLFVASWEEVIATRAPQAKLIVIDRDDLRLGRAWRSELLEQYPHRVEEVETRVIVPFGELTDRHEYAARTLRPRIWDAIEGLGCYPVRRRPVAKTSLHLPRDGIRADDVSALLAQLELDREAGPVDDAYPPGEAAAASRFEAFVAEGLGRYAEDRSRPSREAGSKLSPYLNWGILSARRVAYAVQKAGGEGASAFLEELVVRRDLAYNHVAFSGDDYDRISSLPSWALETLRDHREDAREYIYTRDELESAATHDEAWNDAMRCMKETGGLHNRLRMYWGKQVISWTNTPGYAHRVLRELNDRYLLDGNHPPTYANVGWCFGLHDQPFGEQKVLGKIRPMTRGGLDRKVDLEAWRTRLEVAS